MTPEVFDELATAIYETAHEYTGKIPALAKAMRTNPGTLQHKVNPAMEGHRLNIEEGRAMMLITQDFRILRALAKDCGHAVFELEQLEGVSDAALLEMYANLHKEHGELARELTAALKDGDITPEEFQSIDTEIDDSIKAIIELRERIRGLVKESR